jgi:hypothetical protein
MASTTPAGNAGGAVAAALGGRCQDVANVSVQIAQAEAGMYTGAVDAMNTLASKLDGLKSDAPGNVKSAIDGLEAGFRQAAAVIANPTAANQAKLRELATQLKGDGQTVAAWVASECSK